LPFSFTRIVITYSIVNAAFSPPITPVNSLTNANRKFESKARYSEMPHAQLYQNGYS